MHKINSTVKVYCFHNYETLLKDIKEYHDAILYFEDRVEVKKVDDIENLEKLLELRAFGEMGELRVINNNGQWKGRIRTDEEIGTGDFVEYLDETHLLWGYPQKNQNGHDEGREYTYLSEARGTSLSIPIKLTEGQRAFIIVRNYLHPDVFVFDDFRMVKLIGKEVEGDGK